jgi:cytochrome c
MMPVFIHAKEHKTALDIYAKKCAMCHNTDGPETYEEKKAMVAPPMLLAMKSVTIGVDAIEEPKNKKQLRLLVIDFLKDYVMEPHRDKSFCEDIMFKRFGVMPSLKGFISKEQLDIVIPYVYDTFAPKK